MDNIITSAYEHEGTTAIFQCNVSQEQQSVSFALDAAADYGVMEGGILGRTQEGTFEAGSISDGKADISLEILPGQTVMLSFSDLFRELTEIIVKRGGLLRFE